MVSLGAIAAIFVLVQDMQRPVELRTSPSPSSTQTAGSGSPAAAAGQYTEWKSDSLSKTSGTRVLFFHAPWCPQCRALDKSIKEGKVPNGVTIFKVDYDSNQALRQKYGVTIQTTMVRVDADGNLAEKYVAYESPTLEAVQRNVLD
ncbi:MAG: thioredoxin [Candidatus Saccharibacteria bacterium]|jgi:thiol-disulfide isomerase/thioredoxin|nr:thioredoxin [Candidatus Saccharibacteria bacterium]